MTVLDTSVLIDGLLLSGPARALMETELFHIPHLTDCEVVASLSRMERRGELEPDGAREALDLWADLGIERHPVSGLLPRIWELRHNVKAYDASYVALAEWLQMPLVTRDKRLSRAPGIRCEVRLMED